MIRKVVSNLSRTFASLPKYNFSVQQTEAVNEAVTQTTEIDTINKYTEKVSQHRTVYRLYDMQTFEVGDPSFVAPSATLVG